MRIQTTRLILPLAFLIGIVWTRPTIAAPEVVSRLAGGGAITAVGGGDSCTPIVTPDGRYVLFASSAENVVAASNGRTLAPFFPRHISLFRRDRLAGSTVLVSANAAGTAGCNNDVFPLDFSTNGQFALFASSASDLVPSVTNLFMQMFLRDIVNGTTTLISVATNGAADNNSAREASMTPDARFVAFSSLASNLVAGDTNNVYDVFVRDISHGTTVRDLTQNTTAWVTAYAHSLGVTAVIPECAISPAQPAMASTFRPTRHRWRLRPGRRPQSQYNQPLLPTPVLLECIHHNLPEVGNSAVRETVVLAGRKLNTRLRRPGFQD